MLRYIIWLFTSVILGLSVIFLIDRLILSKMTPQAEAFTIVCDRPDCPEEVALLAFINSTHGNYTAMPAITDPTASLGDFQPSEIPYQIYRPVFTPQFRYAYVTTVVSNPRYVCNVNIRLFKCLTTGWVEIQKNKRQKLNSVSHCFGGFG